MLSNDNKSINDNSNNDIMIMIIIRTIISIIRITSIALIMITIIYIYIYVTYICIVERGRGNKWMGDKEGTLWARDTYPRQSTRRGYTHTSTSFPFSAPNFQRPTPRSPRPLPLAAVISKWK